MYNDVVGVGGEALCALCHLAFCEARGKGLDEDDAYDCAMEFVVQALQQEQQEQAVAAPYMDSTLTPTLVPVNHKVLRLDLPPDQTLFWLKRCARNFASNWRRGIQCRKRYEDACADVAFNTEALSLSPSACCAVSAEDAALARLLRQDLHAACGTFPPASRLMLERFHLHGDSVAEIAYSSGKSEDAVKQGIYRLRGHLRTALLAQGHNP